MKNINKHISLTLKGLRREHGWSLDKTALETGVSKAMLGQIEREESSPSIATLWKIASGFHTSFSSFIEDLNTDFENPLYRATPSQPPHVTDEKIHIMPLFPFDTELNCELFIIELLPGCEHLSPAHDKGVIEHAIVIEGTMEILINGVWQTLEKNQGVRFNANQPHGYRNFSSKTASFHDLIHYPKTKI